MTVPGGNGLPTPLRTSAGATTPPARALRVLILAGASLLLASTGHLLGGGTAPSVGRLAAAGVLLALVAGMVTARRCRMWVLVPLLGAEQALLHLWFSAVPGGCASAAGHHGVTVPGCAPPVAAEPESMSWAMWIAHLVSTVLTAWLLSRGEAWLWRVADEIVAAAAAAPSLRRLARHRSPAAARARLAGPTYDAAAPRGPPRPIALS